MTKKLGRARNKRVLLGAVIGVFIIALAAGAYYFYTQNQKQQTEKATEQKKVVATERKKLEDVAFRGDKDVAAQYMERLGAKDAAGAAKVYEQAAADADKAGQIELYKSAITAARQAKQNEQVLQFSLKLAELDPDYKIYASIATIYAARNDSTREVEYLQKAVDDISAVSPDSEIYKSLLPVYQDKLREAQK